jgi:hypothetical protein
VDPFLIYVSLSAVAAALAATMVGIKVRRGKKGKPEDQPKPEPPETEPPPQSEPPPAEPPPQEEKGETQEDRARAEEAAGVTKLKRAVDMLTRHIVFAKRRELVGTRVVYEHAGGRREVEAEIPETGYLTRPIQGLDELPLLDPMELTLDDDILFERLATGSAMVVVPTTHVPIMRRVHRKVYEEKVRVVYLLLDSSGSMSSGHSPWKPPVWNGVMRRIISTAHNTQATIMLRLFSGNVGPLQRTDTGQVEASDLLRLVEELDPDGGTNIGVALEAAIADIDTLKFDSADIIMVSDGEDSNFDYETIRRKLDDAGIRLHVIMLGVNNDRLRRAADIYQIVEENLTVQLPVSRQAEPGQALARHR